MVNSFNSQDNSHTSLKFVNSCHLYSSTHLAREIKEQLQPVYILCTKTQHWYMDTKPYGSNLEIIHSNWKKTTIQNKPLCLFLIKKNIIEWDKQWKLHCNADRFRDNLVWDNQLNMILHNQFEGEGYVQVVAIYPVHKLDTFSISFSFKTSITNISKLTKSWNYRPGSDITISLNHLATKYPLKIDDEFFKCWRRSKFKTSYNLPTQGPTTCGSSILYCVRNL